MATEDHETLNSVFIKPQLPSHLIELVCIANLLNSTGQDSHAHQQLLLFSVACHLHESKRPSPYGTQGVVEPCILSLCGQSLFSWIVQPM